jgi:hypothetical protein
MKLTNYHNIARPLVVTNVYFSMPSTYFYTRLAVASVIKTRLIEDNK